MVQHTAVPVAAVCYTTGGSPIWFKGFVFCCKETNALYNECPFKYVSTRKKESTFSCGHILQIIEDLIIFSV